MSDSSIELPVKPERRLLPDDFTVTSWDQLQPYFEELLHRETPTPEELYSWMKDRSELEAVLEEDLAWRYIKMNIDTTDPELAKSFQFVVKEVEPKIAPYSNQFDKKLLGADQLQALDQEKLHIHLRKVRKAIEIYREENVPLFAQLQTEAQQYGVLTGGMTIEVEGKELTMQGAAKYLKDPDRDRREAVYHQMTARWQKEREKLNTLFDQLLQLRNGVATNADFPNFRDYMFSAMSRFDYTVQDCYDFHESIRTEILPIVKTFAEERQALLNVEALKPWDGEVDPSGQPALKPFDTGAELLEKSIECFRRVRPFFGDCLAIMREMGHLDLESKKGKAPGGFNYPLYETGVPFVYMNAVGAFRDVVTMVHEGGHAIHSFLSRNLELTAFKQLTSEVAELASMSMELISMEHWDVFFSNEEELKRAKKEQLTKIISILPWIAMIDKFQHWVYENPKHSQEERTAKWVAIHQEFATGLTDWTGEEENRAMAWQKQLHVFEVPFYYIEYGMAQLGAIALWRNYKQNPEKALDQYEAALKLGYTRSIGEIYETAGVKFDFSAGYVKELAAFVREELAQL
ncbi:MAG: M3 family oligoendopeptidase [Salibacteraceae bacterium]